MTFCTLLKYNIHKLFERLLLVTDGRILLHDLLHVHIQKGTLLTIKIGMHFVITCTMHLLHLIIMKRKSEMCRATKTRYDLFKHQRKMYNYSYL